MPTSKFKVCITGDSILQIGADLIYGWERYVDVESGRNPYQKGLENRMSSNEAMQALIPLVAPGGYFVFQDNGAVATQTQWRALLQAIVALLPDDRHLIGVLPVWLGTNYLDTAAKANIMVEEFSQHPLFDWVRWNQLVIADNSYVYDGQHPTPLGSQWLADKISLVTGTTADPPPS